MTTERIDHGDELDQGPGDGPAVERVHAATARPEGVVRRLHDGAPIRGPSTWMRGWWTFLPHGSAEPEAANDPGPLH
jgi:hypothetical protein